MRKLLIILSLFIGSQAIAQEVLKPLNFNPRLYYSTAKSIHSRQSGNYKSFVIVEDSSILVESDTLSLPFVDDFSKPSLKPYNYSSYIYQTIYNAIGPCDTSFPVATVTDTFSFNPTYSYSYNTTTHKVDSTPNAPIVFLNSPGMTGDCFYNLGDTALLYPVSHIDIFDTITGHLTAQLRDTSIVRIAITYTPVLYKSKAPLYTKWLDNNAYQNNTEAYLPPSIGVVTFDGLNAFGQPYNKNSPTNSGLADILTSKPINTSGLTDADSVYLGFFYQPGGFGDIPTYGDSLVLQFYNGYTSQWDEIWSVGGDTLPTTPYTFRQVLIRLPTSRHSPEILYLYNGFQFRFLNYGSLTGNNDIWNIDYVRLDKNLTVTDTSISDLAFQYQMPSILKNYSEMPAEQFTGIADLADTLTLFVDNLNPSQASGNPPATNYTLTANQTFPAFSPVLTPVTNTFNAGLENVISLYPSSQYTPPAVGFDTLLAINSQAVLNINDILTSNDTVSNTQTLYNTLAYDDGSAEVTYGVDNGQNQVKKFAYDFTLHHPDSLVGFQVLYANTDVNVHDLVFNFNLWYNLELHNVFYVDTPIFVSNNETPFYIDSVNGFATYKIAPIAVPTHFYFGYAQTDVRNLQLGYDLNSSKGRPHMFIYASGTGVWRPSAIYTQGSPMIRLILGHTSQIASGIKDLSNSPINVYPNPANSILSFDLPDADKTYSVELYNTLGQIGLRQTIGHGIKTINISNLDQGIYMLRMTDTASGIVYQNKIMKLSK